MAWIPSRLEILAERIRFIASVFLLTNAILFAVFSTYVVMMGLYRLGQWLWSHLFSGAW